MMKPVKSSVFTSALLATLLGTAAAMAGDATTTTTTTPITPAPESKLSGTLNFDLNSHFISYGNDVWADGSSWDGGTFNPSLELTWALPNDFSLILGTWWDVNGKPAGTEPVGGNLQEVDVWGGLGYKIGGLSITGLYQAWLYGEETEEIIDLKFAYDCFLSPYILIHNRIEAGAAGLAGGNEGTILVAGISHSIEAGPVTFSFPLNVAYFFEDDFHPASTDDGLGYGSFGVTATYAMDFLGEDYGKWNLHGGLTYYVTDDDVVGNVKDDFLTGTIGIGCTF